MKRPLIGVTCNYDYRDTVGITSGMGIVGLELRCRRLRIYIGKSRSNPGTDPGL